MADYSLVPVDYQPDFPGISLVPVDYDPFDAGGLGSQFRTNLPAAGVESDRTRAGQQYAQYAPRRLGMSPVPPVFLPGTPENDAFVSSTIKAGRAVGNVIGNVLNSDTASRPPAGSRPINETPWSGDHGNIKEAIQVPGNGDVRISPTDEVWSQNPDGSSTNHGPAGTFAGSGQPGGRRGKDRDRQW